LAACSGAPEVDARRDEIVGGQPLLDGGEPAVFMIYTAYDTGIRSACTATLITPRTLLTAAHCVDPRKAGATASATYFINVPVAPPGDAGTWTQVAEMRFHPQYAPADLFTYDIAAVLLPAPSTIDCGGCE
jgi:V8-like Glu-specific endopeptidase